MDDRIGKILGYIQVASAIAAVISQFLTVIQHSYPEIVPLALTLSAGIGGVNHLRVHEKLDGR